MAVTTGKTLQVVVVTPEKAVMDEPAEFVVVPMHDGEFGILPGRAAVIGRLGPGELRVKRAGATKRYFIDGGFVQVRADVVSVLTAKATPVEALTAEAADRAAADAAALPTANAAEKATKARAVERANGMRRVLAKSAGTAAAH